MAKKKQRKPTSSTRRQAPRPVTAAPEAPSASRRAAQPVAQQPRRPAESRPPQPATPASSKAPDFATEYRYVLGDLRRIGILAAGMFATLAALAFFIR